MESLFEQLKAYGQSDYYPYHMPGHKRNSLGNLSEEIVQIDITEIEGFDNLHQSEGILLKLQEKAAELYNAEQSFYLINGSTGGVLSAISAAVPEGGHILMARNSHKSAYHAAYLRNLTISYLYPPVMKEYDICDAITPTQVCEALKEEPGIQAVFLTSPTYEGRIADVAAIADEVHKAGIPLIVDEAHGAHLGLAEGFAKNSCQAGADIVIHSVHKTLPAMTQAALLHVNSNRVSRENLQRFLHIYQSSSPSYVLMASIDNALRVVEKQGTRLFAEFKANFENMLRELSECQYLQFLPTEGQCGQRERGQEDSHDIGKLIISTKNARISGQELYNILLEEYHLQLEMASASYCLAMFTIGDDKEAYLRMTKALLAIERKLASKKKNKDSQSESLTKPRSEAQIESQRKTRSENLTKAQGEVQMDTQSNTQNENLLKTPVTTLFERNAYPALLFAEAWDGKKILVPLEQAAGCYAGEFINLYPPGIPLLVPGEQITEKHCWYLAQYLQQGLNVQGIELGQAQYYVSVVQVGSSTQ